MTDMRTDLHSPDDPDLGFQAGTDTDGGPPGCEGSPTYENRRLADERLNAVLKSAGFTLPTTMA
jgi:hypothetical protein